MTNLNTEIMKELVFWLIKVNLRQENKNKKRKSGLIDTVFCFFVGILIIVNYILLSPVINNKNDSIVVKISLKLV